MQVTKAPAVGAARRPMQRQVGSLPAAPRIAGLPMSVPPAPIAIPMAAGAPVSAATVRSPSHTPLYSRSRSNGPRSASSFTPMPVAGVLELSGPPSAAQHLASWTPAPGTASQHTLVAGASRSSLGIEVARPRSVSIQPQREEDKKCSQGTEVEIGEHRFRCLDVLGKGSYSEVWRGEVLRGGSGVQEVALKEVRCTSQIELQQAIFEVQVLLALERSSPMNNFPAARVPRCISYKVDPCNNGWKVRTAMTVVPGESLDVFIRHKPSQSITREVATRRGVLLAAKLIRDIGPTLQLLAPIAWHRDVNSHNILIDTVRSDSVDPQDIERDTSFWLIDFGLAVDSQSWVTMHGRWRTEDIGGDSRYWPPSSWIMHLLGPEGFRGHPELCEQYQRRLDIHGLGVTALELLCTIANASPASEMQSDELREAWEQIFSVWHRYREDVWRWWAAVYSVFSAGGDIAPVQAKMVQDRVVEQLIVLLSDMRTVLRQCAKLEQESTGCVLSTVADMIDEMCTFELTDVPAMLGDKSSPASVPPILSDYQPNNSVAVSATAPARTASSVVLRSRPRSPSPMRPASAKGVTSSTSFSRQPSPPPLQAQVPLPWPTQEMQPQRQISPPPLHKGPIVVRQLSPSRGRSPTAVRMSADNGPLATPTAATPRDSERSLQGSARPPGGSAAPPGVIAAPTSDHSSRTSVDTTVTRYKSASTFSSAVLGQINEGGRLVARATSIDGQRFDHRAQSMERHASPTRWVGQSMRGGSVERVSRLPMPPSQPEPIQPQTQPASLLQSAAQTQWTGVLLPVLMSQQRQASATRERPVPSSTLVEEELLNSGRQMQSRDARRSGTPQGSPNVTTRKMPSDFRNQLSRSTAVLPAPPSGLVDEESSILSSGHAVLTVAAPAGVIGAAASGARLRALSMDQRSAAVAERITVDRSPRNDATAMSVTQLRTLNGPFLTNAQHTLSQSHLQRALPTPWLPPPRELSARQIAGLQPEAPRLSAGSLELSDARRRSSPGGPTPNGRDAAAMASRLTEAMAGLSAAVAAAQSVSVQSAQHSSSAPSSEPTMVSVEQSGDGDVGAGPPYPATDAASSSCAPVDVESRRIVNSQELKERMRSLEAHGDEHEKLRERIKNLEESLQRLGRESLERAKLGMEKLAEKYFPKVRGTSPSNIGHGTSHGTSFGVVLPSGTSSGMTQVQAAHTTLAMAPSAMPAITPSLVAPTVALAMPPAPVPLETAMLAGGNGL